MKKITFFTLYLTLFLAGNLYSQQTIWCSATATGANNGTSAADAYVLFSDALGQINSADDILRVVGNVTINGPQNISAKNFKYTIEGDVAGSTLTGANAVTRMFTINAASVGQNVTFKNITFTGSTLSTGAGGGVFYSNQPSVTINFENCRFNGNSLAVASTAGGGALWVTNSTLNITDCLFKENTALRSGGAIYIGIKTIATITRCTFYKNKTTDASTSFGGAALYVTGASPNGPTVNVYNCTFFQNNIGHTNQAYSTIRTEGGITKVFNSLFYDNKVLNGTGGPGDWGSAAGLSSTLTNSIGQWINGNVTNTNSTINVAYTLASSGLYYDDASGKVKFNEPATGDNSPINFGTDGNDVGAWESGLSINGDTWKGTTSSDWSVATNWSAGVPTSIRDVIIATSSNQPVVSSNASINSLTINSGTSVTVNSNINLTVTGAITNNGALTIANNANLIQVNDVSNTGAGTTTINRNSNALSRLDFTLWSSPVTGSQTLAGFSPLTSQDPSRFYGYNESTNAYNAITSPTSTTFTSGLGYLIRMPNTAPATTPFAGAFTGVPNNGTITKAVAYSGASNGYNAIGNPYPSTIDAASFIAANTANIESSLYFWRKVNAAVTSAYAVYNAMGSTATASSDVPSGIIQVGQGFFVKAKSASNVTFTNAMRVANTDNQFFKTKNVAQKDRLWLNLTATSGVFSQALIGYTADATSGVDMYDAKFINDSPVALTSSINGEEYSIQGRPAFDVTDVVTLNFKTDVAGDYSIALDHFDGVFATGQEVFLVDGKTGAETNLKDGAYTFNAAVGTDNTRFSLKFQKTLKVIESALDNNSVSVYLNDGVIYINSKSAAINSVKVFDIQGRLLAEQRNVKANTAVISNLRAKNQILIVNVVGEDNSEVSKKIMN